MPISDADRFSRYVDEADITRLLTRYAWCVDDKRWADWAACFTKDVVVRMPFAGHDGRAGLAEWGRAALESFAVTHHMSTNFEITVAGDRAVGRSKFQAVHVRSADHLDQHFTESGTYSWKFVRGGDGAWLIAECVLTPSWTSGVDDEGLAG